jgi:hypothetical protein
LFLKALRYAKEVEVGYSSLSYFSCDFCAFKKISFSFDMQVPLRYEVLTALAKAIKGCGKGATDATLKEVSKTAKTALTDKYSIIRSAGAEVLTVFVYLIVINEVFPQLLEMCYRFAPFPRPQKLDEFESLVVVLVKALEGATYPTRRSISRTIGLVLSFSQTIKTKQMTAKKVAKPAVSNSGEGNIADDTILSIDEMCGLLLTQFLKTSLRDVKVGIIESYAAAFRELGLSFVESNYITIIKHIVDLIIHPKATTTDTEAGFMRELGTFLVRDILGKMLPEASQVMAVNELTKTFLKRWSSSSPNTPVDSNAATLTLVFILGEVSALLKELGAAASAFENSVYDSLVNLIAHPSLSVNISLAWCLKSLSHAQPRVLPKLIDRMINTLQKDSSALTSEKSETLSKFVALSNCLAAVLGVIHERSLHVSFESSATIFGISTQLLKHSTVGKDPRVANTQLQVAWTLLGALMTLGPNFVKVHLSQLLLLWKTVFPKPIVPKDGLSNRGEAEWNVALLSRNCALGCVLSFLNSNTEALVSIDVAKRIVVCLNNCANFLATVPQQYSCGVTNYTGRKKLVDIEHSLRRRLLGCFLLIKPISSFETSFEPLLRLCIQSFAPDPDVIVDRGTEPVGSTSATSSTSTVKGTIPAPDLTLLTSLVVDELTETISSETRSGVHLLSIRDTDVRLAELQVSTR